MTAAEVIALVGLVIGGGVLGVGGALVKYLVRIERRLTKIEVKMGIEDNG